MFFYVLIFAITIFFCFLAERYDYIHEGLSDGEVCHSSSTKGFFLLSAVILITVAGLRYYVGTDFGNYYNYVPSYAKDLWKNIISLDEPGYSLICKVAGFIGQENEIAIFLSAFITIGLSAKIIYKYSDSLFLAMSYFVLMGCWQASFNAVKQCLAASVVFCGFSYLKERKFLKYLLIVFIAFLFHKSAAIMIVPYFLVNRKVTIKNVAILILISIGVLMSYGYIIDFAADLTGAGDLQGTGSYLTTEVNVFRTLVACAPALYFLVVNIGKEQDSNTSFFLNLLIVHAVLMVMSSNSAYLARIVIYTTPFCAIAIPELLKTDKNRRIIGMVMYILFFAYWLVSLTTADAIPYRWIWER